MKHDYFSFAQRTHISDVWNPASGTHCWFHHVWVEGRLSRLVNIRRACAPKWKKKKKRIMKRSFFAVNMKIPTITLASDKSLYKESNMEIKPLIFSPLYSAQKKATDAGCGLTQILKHAGARTKEVARMWALRCLCVLQRKHRARILPSSWL